MGSFLDNSILPSVRLKTLLAEAYGSFYAKCLLNPADHIPSNAKKLMATKSREFYGEDDVPPKAYASPFPSLFPKHVEIGTCANCKSRFEHSGHKLYCSDACGVEYRKKQKAKKLKQLGKPTILVAIEDGSEFDRLRTAYSAQCRVDLLWAKNAVEAVREIFNSSRPVHFVILDFELAQPSALELLQFVKKTSSTRHIPVMIYFTLLPDPQSLPETARDADLVLTRPRTLKELIAIAKQTLDLAQRVRMERAAQ